MNNELKGNTEKNIQGEDIKIFETLREFGQGQIARGVQSPAKTELCLRTPTLSRALSAM